MSVKSYSNRILGVDPGTLYLGYAIIDPLPGNTKVLCMDTILLKGLPDHQGKLKEIFLQLQELIETYRPGQMAIEAPFFGKNVQAMLKLGRAQGVAIAAAITMGLEIFEYSPKKIKQSITGNGNAAKEQVASMLTHLLKSPIQSKHFDATDALACAVCHHQNSSTKFNAGDKKFNSWKSFIASNPDKIK
ncbi:MAG: crossover junction endodeoxyribonuclease RuvC [Saprospiraceae bacterium]